ncbi:MAG: 6-phosphogluconolactonase [Desulfosoma sp.]
MAQLAARAAAQRGRFFVALSGGSALDLMMAGFRTEPARDDENWSQWHVFWADERWVPWDSPESNYGRARRPFLDLVPIPAQQIHAVDCSLSPSDAAEHYESVLENVLRPEKGRAPQFDLILLGLGQDGHIASLFPDHPALQETLRWVLPVFDAPKPPPVRITLTLPVINQARHVIFAAIGKNKAQIVARVLHGRETPSPLPAQRVRPVDGDVRWFLDQEAAASLSAFGDGAVRGSSPGKSATP